MRYVDYRGEPVGFDPAIGQPYYRKTLRWRWRRFLWLLTNW